LEVAVALLILSLAFTVLFNLLGEAVKRNSRTTERWRELLTLDSAYQTGNLTAVSVKTLPLKDYGVELVFYSYGNFTFVEVKR